MLEAIGLTPAEEELYERLVRSPALDLADLDGDTGPACLARLLEFGLVTTVAGEPARWVATPPGTALDALIRRRGRELAEAARQVAELDGRYGRAAERTGTPSKVEVVYGRDKILRQAVALQSAVRYQIRACDAPPYPEANPAAVNTMELDHLRHGIRYRILYDRRALDVPGRLADLEAGIAAGEQARVTDVPLKMTIVDDDVAVLPLRSPADVESRLVIRDPVLLRALSALFELSWERALPLRVTDGRAQLGAHGAGPLPEQARLLPLLLAGLTDREIAAQLHLSDRTVRARVGAMIARLHATTRFQAGYQAVSRGWLATDDGAG